MINKNILIALVVVILLCLYLFISNTTELFACSYPLQVRDSSSESKNLTYDLKDKAECDGGSIIKNITYLNEAKTECNKTPECNGITFDNPNYILQKGVKTTKANTDKKCYLKNINELGEINPKHLKFTGTNENNKKCIEDCKAFKEPSNGSYSCDDTDTICTAKCKHIEQCPFNAKESKSRHSLDCVKQCISTEGCSIDYCKNTCENCTTDCYWNKFNEEYDATPPSDHLGRPSPPRIFIDNISPDGSKIKIKWKFNKKISDPITEYISLLYKTYKIEDGIKINKISHIYNCKNYCEYVIGKLEPGMSYTVYIRSKNSKGLGKASNHLTFIPKKKQINPIISIDNILNENEFNIASTYNYCNTN